MAKKNNQGSDKAAAVSMKAEPGSSTNNVVQASKKTSSSQSCPVKVVTPAVEQRRTSGDKSDHSIATAEPTTWVSVATAGRPVIGNPAVTDKPVELKRVNLKEILERITQLEAALKTTVKDKKTAEERLLVAEAAAQASRTDMQKAKDELEITKALAAEAAKSHATDSEKWKKQLEEASQEICAALNERGTAARQ